MTISKFAPAPRLADCRTVECLVPGHGQYEQCSVAQFHGGWMMTTCPRCRWLVLNNMPPGSLEREAAQTEQELDHLNAAMFATGITPRFRPCGFDNFVTGEDAAKQRALATCRRYAENFAEHYRVGRALMLLGGIGTGKTHLACAILKHIVLEERATGLIVTAETITQAVSDSFRSNSAPSKTELLSELSAVDLLVIDEVGMHTPKPGKDFTPSLLHEVIDARYQKILPTIIASNQTAELLPAFIGPRAADRLRENGGLLAPFTWASARSGGAA